MDVLGFPVFKNMGYFFKIPDAAKASQGRQGHGGDKDHRGGESRLLDVGLAGKLGKDVGDVAAEDLKMEQMR